MSFMETDTFQDFMSQIQTVETEHAIQNVLDKQLDAELQAYIHRDHQDGTAESPMYKKLPPEIRAQIYSHVVAVDQSVHVFPPKGNEKHGFRLSLCEESNYDFELGSCRCDESRIGRAVQPEFFHNALFLVSQTVRREALDAFFMTNQFTFTCLYELMKFTTMFTLSCSKIQNLRLFERVDDYPASDFRLEGLQTARLALKALKYLDLHIFLGNWSAYEKTYEDGLIHQLLHFAMGPPPPSRKKKRTFADFDFPPIEYYYPPMERTKKPKVDGNTLTGDKSGEVKNGTATVDGITTQEDISLPSVPKHEPQADPPFPIPALRSFKAQVKMRTTPFMAFHSRSNDPKQAYYDALCARLVAQLTDVFMDAGKRYKSVEDVPQLMEKPKNRTREEDQPLTDKRGILFMRD